MDNLSGERIRDCLQAFDFKRLFIEELGWSHVRGPKTISIRAQEQTWQVRHVAELSGVMAFMVIGLPDRVTRLAIDKELTERAYEHLVIFVDDGNGAVATQSLWLWARRSGNKVFPREHLYVKGQPGDLFISKLAGIVVDINELDENGNFPLLKLVERMEVALDVERVTKKFFKEYDAQRLNFVELITGIPDARERHWYASVLLNRLMFIWFLQRKQFLDGGNAHYLTDKLATSTQRCPGAFPKNDYI